MLTDRSGSEMAEAAVTMPVVLLVMLLLINTMMASYTSISAANAAQAGAYAGATTQLMPEVSASNAVAQEITASRMGGNYGMSIQVDKKPGGAVKVMVGWSYPSILSGICRLFGGKCPSSFSGAFVSTAKREGW